MKELYSFILNFLGIGEKTPEPEDLPVRAAKVLALFATVLGVTLIASNLAALKIWSLRIWWPAKLWPLKTWRVIAILPVDAGIWLFPLSYVVGDLLINTFGQKLANLVAVYTSLLAVIVAGILWFAKIALPDFPGVDNGAFNIIQGATGRIFLASVAGFLAGQLVNNRCFTDMRSAQQGEDSEKAIRKRAIISSMPAHLADSVLFELLAFWGRVSAKEFLQQAGFALVAGITIEALLSWKLTPWLALRLKRQLKYNDGKRI